MQRLRRLLRRPSARLAEGVFVLEGAKLLEEALATGARLEGLYADPGARRHPEAARLLADAAGSGVHCFWLSEGVLARLADATTPQPLLAVAGRVDRSLKEVLDARGDLLVCAGVRDPGNLGTLVRSAAAAGLGGVLTCGTSVDLYNPKVVRATAGAIFRIPAVLGGGVAETFAALRAAGYRLVGAVGDGGAPFEEVPLSGPVALVVGNESQGLAGPWAPGPTALDAVVTIPMARGVESLNVGVAGSLLAFELRRRRQGLLGRPETG